jgi:hypothetical protein
MEFPFLRFETLVRCDKGARKGVTMRHGKRFLPKGTTPDKPKGRWIRVLKRDWVRPSLENI